MEGDWNPSRIVVVAFSSMGTAKAWHTFPAYQEILPILSAYTDDKTILGKALFDGPSGRFGAGDDSGIVQAAYFAIAHAKNSGQNFVAMFTKERTTRHVVAWMGGEIKR